MILPSSYAVYLLSRDKNQRGNLSEGRTVVVLRVTRYMVMPLSTAPVYRACPIHEGAIKDCLDMARRVSGGGGDWGGVGLLVAGGTFV